VLERIKTGEVFTGHDQLSWGSFFIDQRPKRKKADEGNPQQKKRSARSLHAYDENRDLQTRTAPGPMLWVEVKKEAAGDQRRRGGKESKSKKKKKKKKEMTRVLD